MTKHLTGPQARPSSQPEIVLPQLPDGYAVVLGDGVQRLSLSHGVNLPGKPDHQRLPNRQRPVHRHGVVAHQPARVHAVGPGNAGNRLSLLYDMDGQAAFLLPGNSMPVSAPRRTPF